MEAEALLRKTRDVAKFREILDELPLTFEGSMVAVLYNLGIALIPDIRAYWVNERITRLTPPPKSNQGARHMYLLALNNAVNACLAAKKTDLGLEAVARVGKLGAELPSILHNVACVYARAGDDEAAVRAIEATVRAGYDNIHLLASDDDLPHLMKREDVKAILARRTGALDARVDQAMKALSSTLFRGGAVPDDVRALWQMLLTEDNRLGVNLDENTLDIARRTFTLIPGALTAWAGRTVARGAIPVVREDETALFVALPDRDRPDAFVFAHVDERGRLARASPRLATLLCLHGRSPADRKFTATLFLEYAGARPPMNKAALLPTKSVGVWGPS